MALASLPRPTAFKSLKPCRDTASIDRSKGVFLVDTLAEVGDEGTSQAYGHLKGADSGP